MKARTTLEAGFPDLWELRGYWGACFQKDSDGDGISDAAEEYYEQNPEEWEERNDFLESQGMGTRDYDDYIGQDSDGPETPEGAVTGGGDTDDPNVNEYGYDHGDWDQMSQDQQAAIAHSHGDHWHGDPPPETSGDDDDDPNASPSGRQTGNPSAPPTFKSDAEREQWLADQRERLYDQQEKGYQENINRGRQDWEQQNRDKVDRLREEGRRDAANDLEKQIDTQRQQWDQGDEETQKGIDQRRSDYIDRPSRESLIKREQDSDTNPERRKMREALANIYPQSSAAEIEELLWRGWAWEAPPPPPSAARLAAAKGPNAVPLFAKSLDPMLKVGWETGEEYLERVETVQAWRDQLAEERTLRESRGEQQFPGESDVDSEERRDAHRQGLYGAPQSALGYALEQLNAQGALTRPSTPPRWGGFPVTHGSTEPPMTKKGNGCLGRPTFTGRWPTPSTWAGLVQGKTWTQ